MKRFIVGMWALALLTSASQATDGAREHAFNTALGLIENQRAPEAARILEALYAETREPRVRLELARAYLFADELARAKEIFVAAYEDHPPPAVKARILRFIEQIDRRLGKFTFGISATRAQNPMRLPSQFGINFAGSTYVLDNSPKKRNVYGAIYAASYERQIGPDKDIRIQGSFRDLENGFGDFRFLDASAGLQASGQPIEFRIGAQILDMKAQSYRMPYVETAYRLEFNEDMTFAPRLQLGSYQPKTEAGLTGASTKLTLPLEIAFNAHRSISMGVKAEHRTARFAEQSYWSAGPYVSANIRFEFLSAASSLSYRFSRYAAVDPFWGAKRQDRTLYASLALESDRIRYKGFVPSLGVYCDVNRSNVLYYKATDCGLLTNINKLY